MKAAAILLVPLLLAVLSPDDAIGGLSVSEADFGGEFSSSGHAPTWVGTLGLGVNTIAGRYDGSPDFDHVSTTLPESLAVVGFTLTTSNVADSPGSHPAFVEIHRTQDRPLGAMPAIHTFSPSDFVEGGITSFGIATEFPGSSRSFDYVWEIVTAPNHSVSFLDSTISVPQTAGHARLRIRYAGTPSPSGTDDLRVRLADGTATAGIHYSPPDPQSQSAFHHYDLSTTRELTIPVPIHLLKRRSQTYFTAELEGLNGASTIAPFTMTIVIEAWHPSPETLSTIHSLERKIRLLKRKVSIAASRRADRPPVVAGPHSIGTSPRRDSAKPSSKVVRMQRTIRRLSQRLNHLKSSIQPLPDLPHQG